MLAPIVSDEEGDDDKELVSPAAISVLEERDRAVSMLYLTAEEMAAEIAAEIGEWDSAMSSISDPDKDETMLALNVSDDDKELVPKAAIPILEERGRVVSMMDGPRWSAKNGVGRGRYIVCYIGVLWITKE